MGEQAVQWYYVEKGVRFGPVDPAQMKKLILAGTITSDTLVWRSGMTEWKPLSQSDLGVAMQAPPPLPGSQGQQPQGRYRRAQDPSGGMEISTAGASADQPQINNVYLWLLALGPLLNIQLSSVLSSINPLLGLLGGLVLVIVLWVLDLKEIYKFGYPHKASYYWILVLTPVYLFLRCRDTHTTYLPAFINTGFLVLFLLVSFLL